MAAADPSIQSRPSRWRCAFLAAALLALTVLAYWPAVNAGFIWDDDVYVTENPTLRNAEGLRRIWFELGAVPQYYPLVHTSFWIEFRLWGLNPSGYHLVNIVLHAVAAVLMWLALRRLGFAKGVAWIAAAVFALHPVHVESVAWIAERKNVLSLVFYLGALLAYLRFDARRAAPDALAPSWLWYAVAMMLFIAALLSKTVTCSLPAAILLLIWWKRGTVRFADVLPTLPMFVIGFAMAMVTAWMERGIVGATGSDWELSIADRVLIAGRALGFYAGRLVWPVNLSFVYERWTIDPRALWQWMYVIGAVGVIVSLWMLRHRIGRGPLTAALLFGGTLLPALGFFDVYPFQFSFVADHFQYHASISFIVLLVAAASAMLQRLSFKSQAFQAAFFACWLIALGTMTWRQSRIYRDQETLWTDTLAKNPNAFLAHSNLALVLRNRGELDRAAHHYQAALDIKADLPQALNGLGVIWSQRGEFEKAAEHFRAAIHAEPEYAEPYNGLGAVLVRQGKLDEAIPNFRRAVELMPHLVDARLNLGLALVRANQSDEALTQFALALQSSPHDPKAHFLMGNLLAAQGHHDAALTHLSNASQAGPYASQANLAMGVVLMRMNRNDEAAAHFREVLRLTPGHPEAQQHLNLLQQQESR